MWSLPKAWFLQGNGIISQKEAGRGDRRIFKVWHRQHRMPNEQQVRVSQRYETAWGWTVSCQERFHNKNCAGLHKTLLLKLTSWISCHRKQAESTLTNKTYYAIYLTVRFVCLGFCIYFMKKYVRPEKLNKLSPRVARLVRNSLPQYSMPAFSCTAKLGSHSWSIVIKYNRALILQDHHNLITMNKLYLPRGWGEVIPICTELCPHAY